MKNDKTEDLHFRVTPEEKERIRERAEKAGLSISDFLRRQALSKKVTVVPFHQIYLWSIVKCAVILEDLLITLIRLQDI